MSDITENADLLEDVDDLAGNQAPKPGLQKGRIRMAFARWWVILVFAVLGYVIALYTLSISEPMHSARAIIEVVTKKRQLVGSDLESDRVGMQAAMMTMCNKILGSSQLTKVVNSDKIQAIENAVPPPFSMKPKYWRSEAEMRFKSAAEVGTSQIVSMITGNLRVNPRPGTMLIDVQVSHMDSQTAVTIADAIVDEFINSEAERKSASATGAYEILRGDAADAATALEIANASLSRYNSVRATSAALKSAESNMVSLKLRYKSKHPKMIVAVAKIERLKVNLRQEINEVTQAPSELDFWSQYKLRMDELEAKMDAGKQEKLKLVEGGLDAENGVGEEAQARMQDAGEAEQAWVALVQGALQARTGQIQSEIKNKQKNYDRMIQRIEDIEMSEKNEQYDLRVAEKAFSSGNVQVDKYKRLGQGIVGGALAGFAIAYILGMLDFKIYDVRTVEEATGLPCLAAVPESAIFDIEEEWVNVLDADPKSANAEAIRNLRASIMLLGKAERNKSILITSAAPGEGKTTIAAELAASFALNEQKTILVDMDLRKPRVHTLFPTINESLGISEVLSGQADLATVVQRTNVQGLHVICAGSKPPNPSELLQDKEIEDVITKLGEYYDRVIVDTPPVLPVSDTRLISRHVQTTIMVVRALKVPVGAIMRTKELLEQARVHVSGVVINAMKRKHVGSGYYGYRGYGEYGGSGGYGGYYDDDDE